MATLLNAIHCRRKADRRFGMLIPKFYRVKNPTGISSGPAGDTVSHMAGDVYACG